MEDIRYPINITYKEAARLLGCSVTTVTRAINRGDIQTWKTGKRKRCISPAFITQLEEIERDHPEMLTQEAGEFLRHVAATVAAIAAREG